jgi:hypothetical protein
MLHMIRCYSMEEEGCQVDILVQTSCHFDVRRDVPNVGREVTPGGYQNGIDSCLPQPLLLVNVLLNAILYNIMYRILITVWGMNWILQMSHYQPYSAIL